MNRRTLLSLSFVLLAALAVVAGMSPAAQGAGEAAMGPIRHIVLFNLKDDLTPETLKKMATAAQQLKADVPEIQTLEFAENLTSNTRNEGYTHCLYVTFKDEAGLKAYGQSKGHETFKGAFLPSVEKVLVFDYRAD